MRRRDFLRVLALTGGQRNVHRRHRQGGPRRIQLDDQRRVVHNRDAIGATITWSSEGTTRKRFKVNGGSDLSSHDMREVLGLGASTKIDWVEIRWPPPSGRAERFTDLPLDRYVTIVEGKGLIA